MMEALLFPQSVREDISLHHKSLSWLLPQICPRMPTGKFLRCPSVMSDKELSTILFYFFFFLVFKINIYYEGFTVVLINIHT